MNDDVQIMNHFLVKNRLFLTKKERVCLILKDQTVPLKELLFFCFFLLSFFQGLYKKRLITKSSPQRQTPKQREKKK